MNKKAQSWEKSVGKIFLIIIAFILGGTGLSILYNARGEITSTIGGFALIGIGIAIIYKIIEDG